MRRAASLLWLVAAASLAPVQASGLGAEFLTIVPDARTVALGSAGVALDDLDANTYYNPANIAFGPRFAASWTHVNWLWDGMSIDYAGVAYRPDGRLGFAANVQYMQLGLIEVTNERGELIGAYRWYDLAPSVSAAYRILPALSAGLTAKAVYSRIYPAWAWPGAQGNRDGLTFAFDAGVQYRPLNALILGFAVANLGPNISYDPTEGDFLPRVARLGFALRPHIPGPVSATVTGEVSRNLFPAVSYVDPWHAGAGLELGFARLAFVRLGYLHYDRDGRRGFTWGVGVEHRGIRLDVGVDSGVYQEPSTRNVRFQVSAVAAAAPFAPGTRFGMVGLDYRYSSGDIYTYTYDKQNIRLDPLLRAGIAVLPNLTIGAEMTFFNTFPESADIFTSTPVFAFGPTATYYFLPAVEVVRPYATAGAGATYAFAWDRLGWRARLGIGATVVSCRTVAFALEGGWYGDWSQASRRSCELAGYELFWLHGSSWFGGVRVVVFK
jgi:hypothetical protein